LGGEGKALKSAGGGFDDEGGAGELDPPGGLGKSGKLVVEGVEPGAAGKSGNAFLAEGVGELAEEGGEGKTGIVVVLVEVLLLLDGGEGNEGKPDEVVVIEGPPDGGAAGKDGKLPLEIVPPPELFVG